MINNQDGLYKRLVLVLLCVVMVAASSGCSTLKKKFTRQKKKDKEAASDFVPVLEPEVYPVKTTGPADIYAQQYSMLLVWISDFADNYQTIKNDKRMLKSLESAVNSVAEMIGQIQSPLAEELTGVKNQIVWVREEFSKPESFRNIARISSELRDVEKALRKKFKPTLVAELFK